MITFWRKFKQQRSRLLVVSGVLLACLASEPVEARIRFAVIGDYGVDGGADPSMADAIRENADRVAAMVHSWNPDFIITVGDNNYGVPDFRHPDWDENIGRRYGQYIQRRSDGLFEHQTSPVQRFFPAIGNHDVSAPNSRDGFIDYFFADPALPGGRVPPGYAEISSDRVYYDFQIENVKFLALDSQYEWDYLLSRSYQEIRYQEHLDDSTADWNFTFFQHAPYSSGTEAPRTLMEWAGQYEKVDAVFAGHDHLFDHVQRHGNDFFVVGTGGQPLYDLHTPAEGSQFRTDEHFGALFVTVDRLVAVFEFHTLDSGRLYSYQVVKGVPEPSSAWMLGAALLAIGLSRHRRSRQRMSGRASSAELVS